MRDEPSQEAMKEVCSPFRNQIDRAGTLGSEQLGSNQPCRFRRFIGCRADEAVRVIGR